ncbi:MAG: InlB B-repeat-containing protein [Paludibacteraceae bacterium]|nr:InlB B-repeat-containing protein [Paludibacteraceae bacterium]
MKQYIKYLCAVLLVIGTSAHAWGATYQVVTSWSQLSDGDVVILASSGSNGSAKVMTSTEAGSGAGRYLTADVTVSSGKITTTSAWEFRIKFNNGSTLCALCTHETTANGHTNSYWLKDNGSNNTLVEYEAQDRAFDSYGVASGNAASWQCNTIAGSGQNYKVNLTNSSATGRSLQMYDVNGTKMFSSHTTGSPSQCAIFKKTCNSPFGILSVGGGATINNYNGVTTDKSVSLAGKQGSGTVTWSLVNVPSSVATIPSSGASSATVRITGTGGQQSYTITVKCHIAASGDYCEEEQTITITVIAKSYTYTYKANGASGSDQTQTVYHGVSTNLKAANAFTAPNCKQFSEWNTSASGSNTPHYTAGQSVTPTGALTLYAIWSDLGPYTVTATSSPAAGGTATIGGETSKSCVCGATGIALAANAAESYYFYNWTKSPNNATGGAIASANSASTTYDVGTANTTLTANFLPYLTLTYDANTGSGAPAAKTDCQSGVSFTLSNTAPTRSNYEFLGWNTSSTATTAQKQPGDSYSITANTTLYAVWCPNISGSSLTVSGTTPTFNYSTGKGSTTFSWGTVTNATAYQLVIRNTTDGEDVYSNSVSAGGSYTFTEMTPGKTYRATVTASNACTNTSGNVDKSIACPAMAGTPVITLPGTIGKTSVTIEFSQTNAVSFNVWLTNGNGDGTVDLGTIAVAAEEIAATNGEASKTFTISADQWYYVHATGKNICGSVSSENSDNFQAGHEATWDHYQFACVDFAATAPSGKAFITSGYDGSAAKTVLAKNPVRLVITGAFPNHYVQIAPSDANVKVYFIKAGSPDKYQEVNGSNQLRIGNDGTFSKDIYFAYAPTAHGDGSVTVPTFTVRCDGFEETFNADGSLLKVRSMPNNFAIIAKTGNTWNILPADMGNSNGVQPGSTVRVNDNAHPTMVYTEEADNAFRLWPVGGPLSTRFLTVSDSVNGSILRFSMPNNLYSSNALAFGASASSTAIGAFNNATLTASSSTIGAHFYWDATTTEVVDGGTTYFKYQLKNPQRDRYLTLSGGKWGMYDSGQQEVWLVPITDTKDAELSIMEWGTNQVVFRYSGNGTIALKEVSINNTAVGTATMERIATSDLYTISGLSTLQANPSKTLQIGITETVSAVNTDKESLFTIPFIVTGTKNNSDLRTDAGDNTSNNIIRYVDVVVRKGGEVQIDNTTEARFNDLYIYPGGKFTIPSGGDIKDVSFQNVYLRGGFSWLNAEFGLPQMLISDGKKIEGIGSSGNGMYYDLYLNNNIYYMMALPKDVALNSVTNEDGDDDWTAWVKGYSGKPRSLNPNNKGWSYVSGPNLERGKGYEIAIKPRKNRPYGTLRFPLMSSAWTDETAISPQVVAWGMTDGELNEGVTANNAGWNLIGNPFFTAYNNAGSESIIIADSLTKKLDANGNWTGAYEWNGTKVKYFTIPGYTTEDYKDVRAVPYKLDAFYPFFVQVNSGTEASPASLTFGTANRTLKLPVRMSFQTAEREVNLDIQLSDESDHTDVMGLNINDEYSPVFDADDKEKTILGGENYMKIYTLVGDYRVAFNSLSETAAEQPIPVGVITPEAGYYTFSLVEDLDVSEVEHVWLWDYEKSSQTDLLTDDYLFYSTPGKLEDRFAINVILKKVSEITTDVNMLDMEVNDVPYKFIWNDQIYIMYHGVVYDITGRRVLEINK